MRVSELSLDYLAEYLRLDEPEKSVYQQLNMMLQATKEYIKAYTGLAEEEIEQHEDITIAALILVGDMYDNRNLYLDYKSTKMNKTVECILGMHSVNLL